MSEVLETVRKVAEAGCHVQIDRDALLRFCKESLANRTKVPTWNRFYHFHNGGRGTVAYFLVLDSINFCFWPEKGKPKWEIQHRSKRLSGYYALALCMKRALESGIPITSAEWLARIDLDGFRRVLGGQGELQLLEDRVQILNELGRVLLADYGGDPAKPIEAAGNSALDLIRLLSGKLVSFRDVASYGGQRVFFYKRAQILAADLYGAFKGRAWGRFRDVDKLTAFADYKLPQVLRHLRILRYGPGLAERVDQGVSLAAGSPEEIEIRAGTIWTVELIRQELERMGKGLRAFEIDWILWNMGQRREFKTKPHHRTATIFY